MEIKFKVTYMDYKAGKVVEEEIIADKMVDSRRINEADENEGTVRFAKKGKLVSSFGWGVVQKIEMTATE